MKPLVSIIIPIYNAEVYLEETILSVLKQSYENFELLLINHASTDKSPKIMEKYKSIDSRVTIINLDTNKGGPAYPRNEGIKISKGKYVAFLDSDDLWVERKLEKQIKYMQKNNYNFTSTEAYYINNLSKNIDNKYLFWSVLKKMNSKVTACNLISNTFIATSSVIVKKDTILNFDETVDFISVEDLYLWLNILNQKETRYKYIPNKLLEYRVLETSVSARGIEGKQPTKANLCILTFILKNSRFDLLPCYYKRVVKLAIISFIKKILKYFR